MSKKVQFVTGLLSGLVFPIIMWLIFGVFCKNLILFDKPALPYWVAIAINLIIVRYFIRNSKELAAYVVLAVTFVLMIAMFMLKVKL